jgi:hypothetical protein
MVHVKNVLSSPSGNSSTNANDKTTSSGLLSWQDLGSLFQQLDQKDRDTWCIETNGVKSSLPPVEFLSPSSSSTHRAYCSFLIQNDKDAYRTSLKRLPFQDFSFLRWTYEPALWIFFGRNPFGNGALTGRTEHTDSVTHDGTWHYQLSGTKRWFLRPTPQLLSHLQASYPHERIPGNFCVRSDCEQGDVIILNTRVWFHRTVIPPRNCPSVSYARDFHVKNPTDRAQSGGGMKNLDGLYATTDIEAGTIVFEEKDMPDCELHRSSDPNCEVVELDDGTGAVVASRRIQAGEFFCVHESSDEECAEEVESDEELDLCDE